MPINTTWSSPGTAGGSGGIDLATGDTLSETVWDRMASDLYRLGGTDGNAKTGKYQIGSATSYSNATNTAGLTVNQGAADDEAVSLKSSDVAHGMTSVLETDTYGYLAKYQPTSGGVAVAGWSSSTAGLSLVGTHTTDDTNKSTTAGGAVILNGQLKSGTSVAALGANANILAVKTFTTTRFLLDADGDSHQDVGTAWTNFDTEDDLALLETLSAHLTREDDPLRATFGRWLEASREPLARLRVVTFNDDGHHFVNWSRTHMLEIGAIRQLGARLRRLEQHHLPG